jgi:glycosyltransferase involved in cell wall biosynthesis
MRILLLSKYGLMGASSRLRSFQYLSYLRSTGLKIEVRPLFNDLYLQKKYNNKSVIADVIKSYFNRLKCILRLGEYDLIWIEKEIFPWVPFFELLIIRSHSKVIVDYDDAIYHRYDQHSSPLIRKLLGPKIDAIMRLATCVIVGNKYLREKAITSGAKKIKLVPTVVEIAHYNYSNKIKNKIITIGWIGSPITAKYLLILEDVIKEITSNLNVKFVAIGAEHDQLKHLPIEILPWSAKSEGEKIAKFDIGIMPLPDEPFERGKCGYKLIQYMACGKPVVASPVGANIVIVKDGISGFLPKSLAEWLVSLKTLIHDPELRRNMGYEGRRLVETKYSLANTQITMEKLLKSN